LIVIQLLVHLSEICEKQIEICLTSNNTRYHQRLYISGFSTRGPSEETCLLGGGGTPNPSLRVPEKEAMMMMG
jgi:hypothetical protein